MIYAYRPLTLLALCALTATAPQARTAPPLSGAAAVQWSPHRERLTYQDLAPPPVRLTHYEQQSYGAVTLKESHALVLGNDRSVTETVVRARLYLTPSAIADSGNGSVWLDNHSQRLTLQAAYVLQPDGTRIEADPATLQVKDDNTSNVFNDYQLLSLPFPQLKPGSIAVLAYTLRTDRKASPLPWSRLLYPASFEPMEQFQAQVSWQTAQLKPVWRSDFPALTCQEQANSVSCRTSEAIPPIPTDPDMPSAYDLMRPLVVAEPTSWAAIANTLQTLTASALAGNAQIKTLATQLADGSSDPTQIMYRLANFVARNIRYVGIEHGRNSVVPRPTLTTLAQRFGDCKDKTMLFVDLAKQVGLDAYPVLVASSRHALDKLLLPASAYFDHLIACVKLSPERESCIDLTDPYTAPESLPQSLQGAIRLTLGRGSAAPTTLATEAYTWQGTFIGNNQLNADGNIVETLQRRYDSHWGASLRATLSGKNQTERDRWLLDDFQGIMGQKTTPSLSLQDLDNPAASLLINSSTTYPKIFNPAELETYTEPEGWLARFSQGFKSRNSHYPYTFKGFKYQSDFTYKLSTKTINNLGPALAYDSPWGSLHRHYQNQPDSITVHTELTMPRADIPLDKLPAFNRFLDLVSEGSRISFSVKAVK